MKMLLKWPKALYVWRCIDRAVAYARYTVNQFLGMSRHGDGVMLNERSGSLF